MMQKTETSGLSLALKLIKVSLDSDSDTNRTIRKGIIKMLRQKMHEVTYIDIAEVPILLKQIEQIAQQEPQVADEVKQLIQKFHPNL